MEITDATRGLAALAQASRLAIFRLLVTQGSDGLAAGDIATRLNLSAATLSFHLKSLVHADLITARQDGRFIYYAANFMAMSELLQYLTDNCCGGAPCAVTRKPTVLIRRSTQGRGSLR